MCQANGWRLTGAGRGPPADKAKPRCVRSSRWLAEQNRTQAKPTLDRPRFRSFYSKGGILCSSCFARALSQSAVSATR